MAKLRLTHLHEKRGSYYPSRFLAYISQSGVVNEIQRPESSAATATCRSAPALGTALNLLNATQLRLCY